MGAMETETDLIIRKIKGNLFDAFPAQKLRKAVSGTLSLSRRGVPGALLLLDLFAAEGADQHTSAEFKGIVETFLLLEK